MARGTWQGSGTWQTSRGGGGLVLIVVIVAAAAAGSGAISAAVSALVTVVIVLGCVLGASVLAGVGYLAYRARSELRRSDRPGRPIAGPAVYQLPPEPRPELEESSNPAIGPPREIHLHFHIADPADAAAIIRTAIPGTAGDAVTEGK